MDSPDPVGGRMHTAIIGRWRRNGLSRATQPPIDKDGLCDEERLADSTDAGHGKRSESA
jgi:hypothetical protein